jgi:hypothetical protein
LENSNGSGKLTNVQDFGRCEFDKS